MGLPLNVIRAAVFVTTSAVANTVTTGTLVAAPGAGFRLRLWGFWAGPVNTAQAIVNWRALATNAVGGTELLAASGATFAAPPPAIVLGGLILPDNGALGYSVSSALVSAVLHLLAFYTVEATV